MAPPLEFDLHTGHALRQVIERSSAALCTRDRERENIVRIALERYLQRGVVHQSRPHTYIRNHESGVYHGRRRKIPCQGNHRNHCQKAPAQSGLRRATEANHRRSPSDAITDPARVAMVANTVRSEMHTKNPAVSTGFPRMIKANLRDLRRVKGPWGERRRTPPVLAKPLRHVNLDFYFQTESSGRLSSRCSITNVCCV